jgi:uncharacterized protein YjiS (DUF1127 family)
MQRRTFTTARRIGRTIHQNGSRIAAALLHQVWKVPELLDAWRVRSYDRDELAKLDDRQLRDIGLTRYDALQEARKPFWQTRTAKC